MSKSLLGLFFIITFIFYASCSTQPPKEDEVKNMVKLWYEQQNQGIIDAGQSDVKGVTILSIKKDEQRKDIFNTISLATGIYHPSPTEGPKPDRSFSDTVRMDLRWNGGKWVTAE